MKILCALFVLFAMACPADPVLPPAKDPPRSVQSDDDDKTTADAGATDGMSDGTTSDAGATDGTAADAGSSNGSSDGTSADAGGSDGSSTGTVPDAGSGDGSSNDAVADAGVADGVMDDAGTSVNTFQYVDNAHFEEVGTSTGWPLGWSINPQVSTEYNLLITDARGNIMEIDRPIVTGSGHWAFMTQSKTVSVAECTQLVLSGEVQPTEQSLDSPGSTQGEFPVHLRVLYEDAAGDTYTYQMGVFYKDGAEALDGGSTEDTPWTPSECAPHLGNCLAIERHKVPQNEWFTLPNVDLMTLDPKPHKMKSFRLGSSGHTFKGRFDNVQLTGSGAGTCGASE